MKVSLLMAVLGFLAGVVLLQGVSGPLYGDRIGVQLEYIEAHRDEINVVFIGSSRVGRNVNPAVFDEAMGALGYETRSYNFWVGNLIAGEARQVVRELLETPPYPDLIVVEALPASAEAKPWGPVDRLTDRALWWRTAADLPVLAEELTHHPEAIGDHVKYSLIRWLRIGKGADMVGAWLEPRVEPEVRGMGHQPLTKPRNRKGVDLRTSLVTNFEPSPERRDHLRRFGEQILAIAGDRTQVLMLLPAGSPTAPSDVERNPNTLAMNRPDRYPELFVPEKWADPVHLLEEGAKEHTRLLAAEVAARIDPDGRLSQGEGAAGQAAHTE